MFVLFCIQSDSFRKYGSKDLILPSSIPQEDKWKNSIFLFKKKVSGNGERITFLKSSFNFFFFYQNEVFHLAVHLLEPMALQSISHCYYDLDPSHALHPQREDLSLPSSGKFPVISQGVNKMPPSLQKLNHSHPSLLQRRFSFSSVLLGHWASILPVECSAHCIQPLTPLLLLLKHTIFYDLDYNFFSFSLDFSKYIPLTKGTQ